MAKAYVIGAMIPAGGAYMAYHLGGILKNRFGYELINVELAKPAQKLFEYNIESRIITLGALDEAITDEDILIANASFSNFLFGARLPGRKIMYAQGFSTHIAIDGHFDLYVSASSSVARYLSALWGINSEVIAPFIETRRDIPIIPWRERPAGSIVVFTKKNIPEFQMMHRMLELGLKSRGAKFDISQVIEAGSLPHDEFVKRLSSVRYLINMSLAEGFGLVPLEAMSVGTMVTGLDGLSGRDYMRYGENCLVASFREMTSLADIVYRALADEELAEACANAGRKTALAYGYDSFEKKWLATLSKFLNKAPHGK